MNQPVVLLVDDEPSLVEGLELRLRSKAFRVLTATSAKEALELMSQQDVAVVVSDERMPGMQGSEFLSVVAKSFPETARIILTGQASVEAAMRAINDAKVAHFLTKPCDAKALKALVEKLLLEQVQGPPPPVDRREGAISLLETLHPGIGHVRRDETGAVLLDDLDDAA
ncbi:MAG: response regulator [Myxococcaceae bacterium]|nr:response regulator [Myxococcaceae bacterium]